MLKVRGKSGADVIRRDLDRVLADAERVARELGALESKLARQGHWLDTHREHDRWEDRRVSWGYWLQLRVALIEEIDALGRQTDNLAMHMDNDSPNSIDVVHIRNTHAPFIGLFCESSDFHYGEPDQYAPQGWRVKEG